LKQSIELLGQQQKQSIEQRGSTKNNRKRHRGGSGKEWSHQGSSSGKCRSWWQLKPEIESLEQEQNKQLSSVAAAASNGVVQAVVAGMKEAKAGGS
jgi:hypothetical protein